MDCGDRECERCADNRFLEVSLDVTEVRVETEKRVNEE